MKHLMTLAALFVSSLAMAQIPTFPWNPDGNGDGVIGSSDLIGLLTVYGQEFQNAIVSENQESAIISLGEMQYHHCQYACENLPGGWQMTKVQDIVPIDTLPFYCWVAREVENEPNLLPASYSHYFYNGIGGQEIRQFVNLSGSSTTALNSVNNCHCVIKQLPRVEYSACADVINDPGCANQLVNDGWYPMGSVTDSGNQAFWRFAQ